MWQIVYKSIFWVGYAAVLITTFLHLKGELNKRFLGPESFHIRLDYLLHLLVYFLICMYYLFGKQRRLVLFNKNNLLKFIIVILFLATITETIQLWVPERAFNLMDWVANLAGVGIGVGIIVMAPRHNGMKG